MDKLKFRMPRSKRGAMRQYYTLMRRIRRAMRGGLTFGMDYPTIQSAFPEEFAHICAMREVYESLPE